MFPCEIQVQESRPTLSIRFKAPVTELPQHFGRIYAAIVKYIEEQGAQIAGPAFAIYYNMDMQNLDVEAGFPLTNPVSGEGEIQSREISAGAYGICHYIGPYDQCESAYDQLKQFANKKGYQTGDVAYEWYLNGPDQVPLEELKTDIALPLIKREVD